MTHDHENQGCWVAFESDVREDDAESLLGAIRQLRGVIGVESSVADPADWIANKRIRRELREKLFALLEDETPCRP